MLNKIYKVNKQTPYYFDNKFDTIFQFNRLLEKNSKYTKASSIKCFEGKHEMWEKNRYPFFQGFENVTLLSKKYLFKNCEVSSKFFISLWFSTDNTFKEVYWQWKRFHLETFSNRRPSHRLFYSSTYIRSHQDYLSSQRKCGDL